MSQDSADADRTASLDHFDVGRYVHPSAGVRRMSDCWKCDESIDGYGNYCGDCGAPQKPSMAAQSFTQSAKDFYRGIDGLLDLIDGCPEMLAEGLANEDGYGDISASEWERRFENSFRWLEDYFFRLWLSHYDLSESDLEELMEEHGITLEESQSDTESFPTPTNETCNCGASLPIDAPSIITRWKEATEATAVCFDCFGQISSRITVAE